MSCRSCSRNPCACNIVPLPYYEDACFQENQCEGVQVFNQYSAVLRISTEWAVPQADSILTLKVAALADILIGAAIWNPEYGEYIVVAYIQEEQLIKVVKYVGNDVPVGTVIPSCTKFIVSIPFQSQGGGGNCIIEVTTSELNTLIENEELTTGCTYVVTDHVQNRLLAGTRIILQAVSDAEVTTECTVLTSYDTRPWRGIYDVTTNKLLQLSDNQGNTCKQYPNNEEPPSTCVDDFDWGNPYITNCLIDNSSWLVDYGMAPPDPDDTYLIDRIEVTNQSILDTTLYTGVKLYNLIIHGNSDVELAGNGLFESVQIINNSIINFFCEDGNAGLLNVTVNQGTINTSAESSVYIEESNVSENGVIRISDTSDSGGIIIVGCSVSGYSSEIRIEDGVGSVFLAAVTVTGGPGGLGVSGIYIHDNQSESYIEIISGVNVATGGLISITGLVSNLITHDSSSVHIGQVNVGSSGALTINGVSPDVEVTVDLSNINSGATCSIAGIEADVDIQGLEITSESGIGISDITDPLEITRCLLENGAVVNVTIGGIIYELEVSMGTLSTVGFNVSSVYLRGLLTRTLTANNTTKGQDYFNNNIV